MNNDLQNTSYLISTPATSTISSSSLVRFSKLVRGFCVSSRESSRVSALCAQAGVKLARPGLNNSRHVNHFSLS